MSYVVKLKKKNSKSVTEKEEMMCQIGGKKGQPIVGVYFCSLIWASQHSARLIKH